MGVGSLYTYGDGVVDVGDCCFEFDVDDGDDNCNVDAEVSGAISVDTFDEEKLCRISVDCD